MPIIVKATPYARVVTIDFAILSKEKKTFFDAITVIQEQVMKSLNIKKCLRDCIIICVICEISRKVCSIKASNILCLLINYYYLSYRFYALQNLSQILKVRNIFLTKMCIKVLKVPTEIPFINLTEL